MSLLDRCGAGNAAKTKGSGITKNTALYWLKRSNWRASRSHSPMTRPTMTQVRIPHQGAPLICLHRGCQHHKPPIPPSPALIRFSNGLRSSALPMTQPPWLRGCNYPSLASTFVGRRYGTINVGPSVIVDGHLRVSYRGEREGDVEKTCGARAVHSLCQA